MDTDSCPFRSREIETLRTSLSQSHEAIASSPQRKQGQFKQGYRAGMAAPAGVGKLRVANTPNRHLPLPPSEEDGEVSQASKPGVLEHGLLSVCTAWSEDCIGAVGSEARGQGEGLLAAVG